MVNKPEAGHFSKAGAEAGSTLAEFRLDASEGEGLEAGREILELCVAVGGTISGEHGIGTEKSGYMGLLFSDTDLSLMQALRDVWNPKGLCNPGKLFPTSSGCAEGASLPSVAAAPGTRSASCISEKAPGGTDGCAHVSAGACQAASINLVDYLC